MTQERRAVGTSLEQPYLSNQYGADGELLTLTDANNNLTANTYDGFDRLIQTNYPVATLAAAASNPADFEAYTYDPNDNRLTDRRRDGVTLTYGYDALKRVVSKSVPAGSGGPVVTRTAYDLQGHPLSVVYASTGTGITYSYDGVGRTLTEATNGYTLTYAYDADSNLLSMTWPDGQAQAFAYDSADHAISMGSAALPTTVGEQFTYDPAGRLTGVTRPNGFTTAITLDGASRLTGLAHGFSNATYNVAYGLTYTPAGQAASRSLSNASYLWPSSLAQNQTKAADGLNRDAAIAAVSGGYDPRGNLTFDGTRTFTYDEENRLTSETGPATASLGYDPLGRLTGTVINGATTNFLYSGSKLVAEYDGSGNLIRRYFHGEGVDSPDIWVEGPTVSATNANFLVKDRQGSVIAAVNSAGLQTAVYKYGPYGEPDTWGGSRFRYTGQIEIPELALYHYKGRVYDPVAGRFLQTDPIGYKDGPDWYLYVHGDPLNKSDDAGLCATSYDVCHYTEVQTLALLKEAYKSATAGPISGLLNIRSNSVDKYDFGYSYHADDTWIYKGQLVDADHMGNFIAGFEAAAYDRAYASGAPAAELLVELGGIGYHLAGNTKAENDPFDETGMPAIQAGERAGAKFNPNQSVNKSPENQGKTKVKDESSENRNEKYYCTGSRIGWSKPC